MYSIVSASTGSWTCNFPRNFNRTFVKFVTLVSRENTILFLTDVVLFFKWQLQTSYPAEEEERTPVKNASKRFIGIKRLEQPEISRKEANLEKLVSNWNECSQLNFKLNAGGKKEHTTPKISEKISMCLGVRLPPLRLSVAEADVVTPRFTVALVGNKSCPVNMSPTADLPRVARLHI